MQAFEKETILKLVKSAIPQAARAEVLQRHNKFTKTDQLFIMVAASDVLINDVRGQYPQRTGLSLDLSTLELRAMNGAMVMQRVFVKPQKNKNLVMEGIRIPFRKPKPKTEPILRAITKYFERWTQLLKDNREILMYSDLVDYDQLLK